MKISDISMRVTDEEHDRLVNAPATAYATCDSVKLLDQEIAGLTVIGCEAVLYTLKENERTNEVMLYLQGKDDEILLVDFEFDFFGDRDYPFSVYMQKMKRHEPTQRKTDK